MRIVIAAMCLTLLGCGTATPTDVPVASRNSSVQQAEASTQRSSIEVPVSLAQFVPCANGGGGEVVQLSGTLVIKSHTTLDDNGGFHLEMLTYPEDAVGTGLTSGDRYRLTGAVPDVSNFTGSGAPFVHTFINNFRIIGQTSGNNLLLHETSHATVAATGQLAVFFDKVSLECL